MPKKDVKFWLEELSLSSKHENKWRERARKVIRIYRDDHDTSQTHFNILWSNTQTQRPALYSSTPKPVIKRRHRQESAVGRSMAKALERSLVYSLDPGGSYDFDRVGEKLILDYLLPGRMVARVKYHPTVVEQTRSEEDEDGFTTEETFDEVVDEEVRCYHIPWDQYRQSIANCWEDVWWVAYGNNFLTKEEIVEQFGEQHANVPLTHISHTEEEDGASSEGESRQVKRAQVWEIWDKEDRVVYAVIKGYDQFLIDKDEDPLRLRGFYPGPEPILIVETPDSLIPIPEYTLYQYQADELNKITLRISNLVDAMKLSGLYPGSQKDIIKEMLNSKENTLVPVEDWGAITERGGLAGMIEWIPLRDVADAWQRLMVHRTQLVQSIFELTGISDIQRGSTDPRETKGAQQLKASFGNRRFLPKQQDTQRFFRDLFRIQAEIIAEHFQPETIAKMAQIEPDEGFAQAVQVMKDDALRSYTIDIETDSTIAADEAMEKQGVAEFTAAMSQFLGQIFPIVQAAPKTIGPLGKMLLWMSRKFRIARDAEDEIEDFLESFQNIPDQQDKEGDAKAAQAKADMQIKAQQAQADQQLKQAETQADIQRKDAEAKAKIEREERMAALDERKAQLDIAEKELKIRLMREEAEVKVILSAVDQQTKSSQQDGKGSGKISVDVESPQAAKKIKLLRDGEGNLEGAEVTPVEDKKSVTFNRDNDGRIAGAEVN